MHSYVQVLTTPTADTTGTAVILDVGKRRYLIGNIHEGLSRACTQRNARMAKISEIFISGRTEWRNTGGLIGCILTLADANASSLEAEREKLRLQKTKEAAKQSNAKFQANQLRKAAAFQKAGLDLQEYQSFTEEQQSESPEMPTVNVHGAQNLTHALATARRFVFRKGMPVTVEEHVPGPLVDVAQDRDPDWTDDFIQVWKLPIEPSDRDRVSPNSLETPRKRSFDDYSREDEPLSEHDQNSKESPLNTKEGPDDQEIRRFVVKEMFNSAWRSNELTETPFKDVQLPAAVWIRNRGTGKLERYLYRDGEPPPDINVFVRKPWPGSQVERLPQAQPSRIAMSYIFRHFRQKGKFNAQKANELNVDKLVWSVLQSGISVLSNDKTTVTPEMVLEPSVEGGGFAVVDLPSNEYVQVLTQRPEWKASRIIDGLQACIWILGPNVIQNEELREFITHHSNLKHIISSPDISPNYLSFDSSSALLVRLNQIDAQRYSIPIYDNVAPLGPVMSIPDELSTSNILGARRDLQVQLQPKLEIQKAATATPFLDISHVAGETPEEVLQLANIANEEISLGKAKESQSEQNLPSPDAQVICLGTGSSAPSKHRNVSATLLRIPNCGSYMFDCGEGTVGQLKRLYSPQKINEVLTDLKAIWISHLHADHHLGIASLIIAWREMNLGRGQGSAPSNEGRDGNVFSQNKKLFIFSGSGITEWLQEYAEIEEGLLDNVVLVYCNRSQKDTEKCGSVAKIIWDQRQVHSDHPDFASIYDSLKEATGIMHLESCPVDHCIGACAVSVGFPKGFKFSYSGDCRPSQRFAKIGKDSTVLVHEATFDDDMARDAKAKKHCTMSEAIGVGLAMNAKRLILTHFSQRYQKLPTLAALDKMEVQFDDPDIEVNDAENLPIMDVPTENPAHLDKGSALPDTSTRDAQADASSQSDSGPQSELVQNPPANASVSSTSVLPRQTKRDLKIAVAFDFLNVRVGDIGHLEKFHPALQRLFEILGEREKLRAETHPSEIARREAAKVKEEKREKMDRQARENKERKAKAAERMKQKSKRKLAPESQSVGGASEREQAPLEKDW